MTKLALNALKDGERGRVFRVVTAYTTRYNPEWANCVEFDVLAVNGAAAKKAAIKARREMATAPLFAASRKRKRVSPRAAHLRGRERAAGAAARKDGQVTKLAPEEP